MNRINLRKKLVIKRHLVMLLKEDKIPYIYLSIKNVRKIQIMG